MTSTQNPLLDAELAAFMQQDGISLTLGSCGADLMPSVGRAAGCKVAPDRGTVHLFVSRVQVAPVLAHVRETGRIAAVFSRPSTHRTLQLKGRDARIDPVTPADLPIVARYRNAFAAELAPLGYAPVLVHTLLGFPDDELVMISFTPQEAYSQTPGPNAGRALQVAE
ncbi:MAG: hypothetical protein ACXWC2_20380 [Ramlibacter sp.]